VRISEEKRRKKEETPAAKYNGLSYRVAQLLLLLRNSFLNCSMTELCA